MGFNFINKLPFELKNQILWEYNSRIRELEYVLKKKKRYSYIKDEDIEVIKNLLFLGIFYRKIINPISGAIEFTDQVNQLGIPNVKIGAIKLTQKNLIGLSNAVKEFERIINKFGLNAKFFDFDKIEDFLHNISIVKIRGYYEF